MPDYTPVNNVDTITLTTSAVVTGGQLLDATGNNTCGPSGGALRPIGVALHDAPSGGRVTLAVLPGAVHEVTIFNAVTIAAGAPVIPHVAAANGTVDTGTLATVAAAGVLIGVCLVGGTGNAGGTVKARFIGI